MSSIPRSKAAVVCQLQAIADHYLLGEGSWPVHTEAFPALHKEFRELGLSEDIPDQPDFERSTALGLDLQLDLLMAFIGAQPDYEIVIILEQNGYNEQSEADIYFDLRLSRLNVNFTATWFEHILSIVIDHYRHIEFRQ